MVSNLVAASPVPNALLTVLVPPSISAQPQSLTVTQGTDAPFAVTAAGTAPLSYQWLLNGAPISGATDSDYTVINAQSTNAGSYSVVVSNAVGQPHQFRTRC